MSEMTVYRVARNNGVFPLGPYAGIEIEDEESALFCPMWDAHCTDGKHPTPFRDSGGTYEMLPWDVCAFSSLDALYEWFDGYVELLNSTGFRIWKYTVDSEFVREFPCQTIVDQFALKYVDDYSLV